MHHRLTIWMAAFAAILTAYALAPSTASAQGQRIRRAEITEILPNPYSPNRAQLQIAIWLPFSMRTTLDIFSTDGRLVASLLDEVRSGDQRVTWDGRSPDGTTVPNGVYVVRLVAGKTVQSKNVVVLW